MKHLEKHWSYIIPQRKATCSAYSVIKLKTNNKNLYAKLNNLKNSNTNKNPKKNSSKKLWKEEVNEDYLKTNNHN